ncbi:MAG: carboxypeptidase regulatory-like domain-containing protein [candidate division NC10 bacterium]|nr:carboxypeptidase regulatory-like domain-containing protein [candidate division NC10 bacterium]
MIAAFSAAWAVCAWGAAFAYDVADVKNGGVIEGKVTFSGSLPPPKVVQVGQDAEVCGKTQTLREVEVKDGGLKNSVVRLVGVTKGKKLDLPAATLDQKGCVFIPHVVLTAPGNLAILNSDPVSHNAHTDSVKNDPVNAILSKLKKRTTVALASPEIIPVKCDQHGWMTAYVVVAEHPYYAVTDEVGIFRLRDVPPGRYTIETWHEKLGKVQQQVTVEAGKTTSVTLAYK